MSNNKQPKQSPNPAPRQKAYDPQRAAQEARRAAKRANARSRAARQRAVTRARARSKARGVLGWLSWWATYEMDRRAKDGDDDITTAAPVGGSAGTSVSAGGRDVTNVGGGFAWLREWGARRTAAVLTLLVLAGFTGSIALGAGSIVVGIIAFLFFTAALAMATAARAQYRYRRRPADIQPPLEPVSDFHIEDMEIDDSAPSGDVNSLDDLERSFEPRDASEPSKQPDVPAAPDETKPEKVQDSAEPDLKRSVSETEASSPQTATTTKRNPPRVPRMREGEPDVSVQAPTEDALVEAADGTHDTTATDEAGDETDPGAATDPGVDIDAALNTPIVSEAELTENSDTRDGSTEVSSVEGGTERAELSENTRDDATKRPDETAATETKAEAELPAVKTEETTALSLLAAETPGQDLLAAYTASQTHLQPEAVRDVAATLIVSDLDRSVMFYTQLLGLVEIDRARDAVLLEAGFGRVLLWRRDDSPGVGAAMHLTFEVGDIDAAYLSLRNKGVVFTHSPRSALAGHVHELRAASFLDPDGHGLAITQLQER